MNEDKLLISNLDDYDQLLTIAEELFKDDYPNWEEEYDQDSEEGYTDMQDAIADYLDDAYNEAVTEIYDAEELKDWWRHNGWLNNRGYGNPNQFQEIVNEADWETIFIHLIDTYPKDEMFGAVHLTPVQINDIVLDLNDFYYVVTYVSYAPGEAEETDEFVTWADALEAAERAVREAEARENNYDYVAITKVNASYEEEEEVWSEEISRGMDMTKFVKLNDLYRLAKQLDSEDGEDIIQSYVARLNSNIELIREENENYVKVEDAERLLKIVAGNEGVDLLHKHIGIK